MQQAANNSANEPTSEVLSQAASIAALNLKSLDMFPCLNNPQPNGAVSHETQSTASPKTEAIKKLSWAKALPASKEAGLNATKSSTITQVVQLPFEQQRKYREFGDRTSLADVCKLVGQATDTAIDASTSGQTRSVTFVIKGSEAAVSSARRQLWSRLAESISISVEVPVECLRFIIGPAGKTMQGIMAESSTKIKVPKSEEYEGHVGIVGDLEGVSLAKDRIEAIVHERTSKLTTTLSIEKNILPFISNTPISSNTSQLGQLLSEQHGCRVSISPSKDSAALYAVILSGEREVVQAAAAAIARRHEELRRSLKLVSTQIAKPLHRYLIGPKASILHQIENDTGCLIIVPAQDDPSEQVQVYGPDGQLLKGLSVVLERTNSMASQSIPASRNVQTLLMHRCRLQLKLIETTRTVTVHMSDIGLQVDGKKESVADAVKELEALLAPLADSIFDVFAVDPRFFKHIIGKKGQNIQQLNSEFGVDVLVPNEEHEFSEEEGIILVGQSAKSIQAAKTRLEAMISNLADFVAVELRIENKYHRALIGLKGSNFKRFHDKYPAVSIKFDDGNLIRLKGPSADVNALQEELKAEAEDLRSDAIMHGYTVEVPLQPDSLEHVLDRTSSGPARWLTALAREMDVRLDFIRSEKGSSETEVLTVKGLKKAVDEAKVAIVSQLAKMAEQTAETFSVEHKYHSMLIGRSGKNVKHLAQKYAVKVSFPAQDDTANSNVTMSGPKSTIKAAKEELLEFLESEIANNQREEVVVPGAFVISTQGRGAGPFDAIAAETKTRIKVQSVSDGSFTVSIEGPQEAIKAAKTKVLALVRDQANQVSEAVAIPSDKFEKMMTIGLHTYRRLASKLEGLVQVTSSRGAKDSPTGSLILRGCVGDVEKAKADFATFLAALDQYETRPVKIAAKYHGEIIGQGGANVRQLCEQFDVAISFPRSRSRASSGAGADKLGVDDIVVTGVKDHIDAAVVEMKKHVRESKFVPAQKHLHKAILGKIKSKLDALNVQLIERRDGFLVSGPVEVFEEAASLVLSEVGQQESSMNKETLAVPRSQHRHIIGRGGAQISALRESTRCHIIVPGMDLATDQIVLQGSAESILKAKEAIHALLDSRRPTEDASIPAQHLGRDA